MIRKLFLVPVILTVIGSVFGSLIGLSHVKPVRREILIKARQYAYEPARIEINKNDTLHIKLVSLDVVHGFYVEGYDIDAEIKPNLKTFKIRHPSRGYNWKDTTEIILITSKIGKFRYRCSHTCGSMHPFMQGEMIVKPNTPYHAAFGGIIGFCAGMLLMIFMKIKFSSRTGNNDKNV